LGTSIPKALRRVIEYPVELARIAEIVEIALELLIYFDCNSENSLKDNALLSPSRPHRNQQLFWPDVSKEAFRLSPKLNPPQIP
jgi:hypothetical protein